MVLPVLGAAFEIKPMEFIYNLRYMGEGMLGILVVMLVIIGSIVGMNFFLKKKNKDK